MAGGVTAARLVNGFFETKSENYVTRKEILISEEEKSMPVESQHVKKLFGRQKSVHILLGGGKSADVFLWRNKKISGGILASATAIWVLLLWLNHNFMSLVCFSLVLGLLAQFVWSNISGRLSSSKPSVPRVVLPDELFVDVAKSVAVEVNRGLSFLQNVACGGKIKQLIMAIVCLSATAILASFCNFVTLLYIGFVATQTLPVVYEKYEDQIDDLLYNFLDQLQQRFQGKKQE